MSYILLDYLIQCFVILNCVSSLYCIHSIIGKIMKMGSIFTLDYIKDIYLLYIKDIYLLYIRDIYILYERYLFIIFIIKIILIQILLFIIN
jgi:hypothetical protein